MTSGVITLGKLASVPFGGHCCDDNIATRVLRIR